MDIKRNNRETVLLCAWGGDTCVGAQCVYANCVRRKLKSDLTCGLEPQNAQQQQERKVEPKLEIEPKKQEKWSIDQVPIKTKALKKIKNLDYDLD
jgi:hypothetical protein